MSSRYCKQQSKACQPTEVGKSTWYQSCPASMSIGLQRFMHAHACSCVLMHAHACSCMLMRVQLKNFERTHFPSVLHRDQACKRMHHGCQICILTAKGYNINVFSPHAWRECICLLGHCSPQVKKQTHKKRSSEQQHRHSEAHTPSRCSTCSQFVGSS